jgi:hypothetical protein
MILLWFLLMRTGRSADVLQLLPRPMPVAEA